MTNTDFPNPPTRFEVALMLTKRTGLRMMITARSPQEAEEKAHRLAGIIKEMNLDCYAVAVEDVSPMESEDAIHG
jgi:diphthamide synthase subunit DPH2